MNRCLFDGIFTAAPGAFAGITSEMVYQEILKQFGVPEKLIGGDSNYSSHFQQDSIFLRQLRQPKEPPHLVKPE